MSNDKWTTKYADLDTGPIPIAPYLSSERYERERERIWRKVWLNVGRVEEIPAAGDYFVRELAVSYVSILVVRGRDGVIRGFHNVCTHRGNKLTRNCNGHVNGFVCGFHGWAFDLTGNLIRVTDKDEFFDLKESELGLVAVATDVWEGFIFINLDPQPQQSLKEFLGEPGAGLTGYPFGQMTRGGFWSTEVRANWKVSLNSFQEGYHVPFLHRRSAGRAFASKDSPVIHALAFQLYRQHRMMSISGSAAYRPTATELIAYQFGTTITNVAEKETAKVALPAGLNPTKSPAWVFDMIVLFPNFFMFVFDGTYFTYHFWPLAADRTLWETTSYYSEAMNAGQRFSQEYAKVSLRDTLMEDGNTLEAVQAGMASGARSHFIVQDQELLIRHSHKVIEEMIA